MKAAELFEKEVASRFRLPDEAPLWDWMHDNITLKDSPYGGKFVISETPWLREPLSCITDPAIMQLTIMSGAQLGKTTVIQGGVAWALSEDPGPTMVISDAGDSLENLAENKINPVLESCPALARVMPDNRNGKKKLKIKFPQATVMMGPANDSFLRSHSIRYIFGTEVSAWSPGNVQRSKKRTTRWSDRKRVYESTPKLAGDDFCAEWEQGSQEEWNFECLGCGGMIEPDFSEIIKWDENEATRPEGKWDFKEVRKTVRLECPECGHAHKHTAGTSRMMNNGGRYVAKNPGANERNRSFRFTALCLPPSVCSWEDLVEEFIRANQQAKTGYTTPLQEFVNLQLGQPWVEERYVKIKDLALDDYDPSVKWDDQAFTIMTVDCQQYLADFWVCIRQWSRDGRSRLVRYERPKSFEEVEEIREQNGVKSGLVFVDRMYKPDEVAAACAKYGWRMMQGEDTADYLISETKGKRKLKRRRPVSNKVRVSISRNSPIVLLFRWSNPTVKDILATLKEGKGAEWLACDVGEQTEAYQKQVNGERKTESIDRHGNTVLMWKKFRENHALDCECMQVAAAIVMGCFGSGEV